jgi:hypothetical protein
VIDLGLGGIGSTTRPSEMPLVQMQLFQLKIIEDCPKTTHKTFVDTSVVFVTGPVNEVEISQYKPFVVCGCRYPEDQVPRIQVPGQDRRRDMQITRPYMWLTSA